jgi:hypothetical protein
MLHQARIVVTLPEKPTAAGSTPRTLERCLQANVCGKMIALGVTLPLDSFIKSKDTQVRSSGRGNPEYVLFGN